MQTLKHTKNDEHGSERDRPWEPAALQRPPKRDAFQIAEKQRRAHREERTAHVAHRENEKRGVYSAEVISVHRDPRADQQHRRAGRADDVSEQSAAEQKKRI
jgi:hypothetical protein